MKKHEENPEEIKDEAPETAQESAETESEVIDKEPVEELSDLEKAEQAAADAKDKYLRLYSEFENFRRRTAKERIDLIATASRDVIENLLSVLDDFDRASQSANDE
ncbi:MAG: nucleotide exchange factor GrpE, partial [Cyclobacteriaceae bacterium]